MKALATSMFGPPGGVVVRAVAPLPVFDAVNGPLTGERARLELERVWPLLEAAILAYAQTHDFGHVWSSVETGDRQLWTAPNAALVSEILVWPTGLREASGWLAGGDLDELLSMQPAFEAWARSKRCKRVGIQLGRDGWERKLAGYRKTGIRMAKDLTK